MSHVKPTPVCPIWTFHICKPIQSVKNDYNVSRGAGVEEGWGGGGGGGEVGGGGGSGGGGGGCRDKIHQF